MPVADLPHHPEPRRRERSPVLLLGAGTGEATCGILYLASALRRAGFEAVVRLTDLDETPAELRASLSALLAHVKPRLVGISLKWFHHVARARVVARLVKQLDPSVHVVLGGNSASAWWQQLVRWPEVDSVALGDGEGPLLALARGDEAPVNVVTRATSGSGPARLGYVQGASSDEVYYSHFDQLFLSGLDASSYSGWVAPGKGCGENCVYCGGTRGLQQATFGRAKPFLRPDEAVLRDHQEVVPRTWQLRYDFAGSTGQFLERAWGPLDLSRHATTYFLWGIPAPDLVETLARRFGRVFMVLDIGCFSHSQRAELRGRGLLKPCPTDEELFRILEAARRFRNLEVEVSGIAALPFASQRTVAEERALVERLLEDGCTVGYQRLEAQPGALVTEHPERFEMRTEARTLPEFLRYFEDRELGGDGTVPMLRFRDARLEATVEASAAELEERAREARALKGLPLLSGRTRLVDGSAARATHSLGDWLGNWKVPSALRAQPVTTVRSNIGAGLSCTPDLSPKRFRDAALEQGDSARALLAVLDAFAVPRSVDEAVAGLKRSARLTPDDAHEVIEHLVAGRFLLEA